MTRMNIEFMKKVLFQLLKKHNGTFITFDDSPEVLEGPRPLPGRAIIFSFLIMKKTQIIGGMMWIIKN